MALGYLSIDISTKKPLLLEIQHQLTLSIASYEEWMLDAYWSLPMDIIQAKDASTISDELKKAMIEQKASNVKNSMVATCSNETKQKTKRFIHAFESNRFLPIEQTIYELQSDEQTQAQEKYKVVFNEDLQPEDMAALYGSYQYIISQLNQWLTHEWANNLASYWQNEEASKEPTTSQQAAKQLGSTLTNFWMNKQTLKSLFERIAQAKQYQQNLQSKENAIDYQAYTEAYPSELTEKLILSQDKCLLFILVAAITSWVKLLPTTYATKFAQTLNQEKLTTLLAEVLLANKNTTAQNDFPKLGEINEQTLLTYLQQSLTTHLHTKTELLQQHYYRAKRLILHGEANLDFAQNMNIAIKGETKGSIEDQTIEQVAVITRGWNNHTSLEQQPPVFPDYSVAASNPNQQSVQAVSNTQTHGAPISMVTGEELLSLTDDELNGSFPFTWKRLYRSSAVEQDVGLGQGWSHCLSHQLTIKDDQLIWTDHENKTTQLVFPTKQAPAVTNNLAKAAAYLGKKEGELVIIQADKTITCYHFMPTNNHAMRLERITDRYNNALFLDYKQGQIERISNQAGYGLHLRYNQQHIVAVDYQQQTNDETEQNWRTLQTLITYHYNEKNQLIGATNANNETEHYHYDQEHLIQKRELADGAIYYWQWQGNGKQARCIEHWANFAQLNARYEWQEEGTVIVHNQDGSQLTYTHNDQAKLIKEITADGAETVKTYDQNSNLTTEVNPLGGETHYIYDEFNQLRTIITPDGETTNYTYNQGFISQEIKGKSIWQYQRNERGDIIAKTDPLDRITRYHYNPQGKITTITYPNGSQHQYTWNNQGQLLAEKLPTGETHQYRYDAFGRCIYHQNAEGQTTQYTYDKLGRVIKETKANGISVQYQYNAANQITQYTDELGQVTHYHYDTNPQLLTTQINPNGSKIHFQYHGGKAQPTLLENEQGEHYQFSYYPSGLLKQEIAFDGRITDYQYDLMGNLTAQTEYDAQGNPKITHYQYNEASKLQQKTTPDGTTIHYQYNEQGQLISIDDGHWPLHYEYDLAGQVITEHQGWATLHYQYNSLGKLSQCRLPDGNKVDYHYNQTNTLERVMLNQQLLTQHFYAQGLEVERTQGKLSSLYDYDNEQRLTRHFVQEDSILNYNRQYYYNASGNIQVIKDSQKGERYYQYDPMERLISVKGEQTEHLTHDLAGNLLYQSKQPEHQTNVQQNRLVSQGGCEYRYDTFGNLVQKQDNNQQTTYFHYNDQHQLVKVELPTGETANYQYDALGRRVRKTVINTQQQYITTDYIWHNDKLLVESSKHHYQSYLYEPNSFRPLVLLKGKGIEATAYYYQLDHLGTPQELTDQAGNIAWSASYRAYGSLVLLNQHEVTNPLRFQNQYHDLETGLYYNFFRYYDPATGRYITQDPIKLKGGLNAYQYTQNPGNEIDPLGLWPDKEFLGSLVSKQSTIKEENLQENLNSSLTKVANILESNGSIVNYILAKESIRQISIHMALLSQQQKDNEDSIEQYLNKKIMETREAQSVAKKEKAIKAIKGLVKNLTDHKDSLNNDRNQQEKALAAYNNPLLTKNEGKRLKFLQGLSNTDEAQMNELSMLSARKSASELKESLKPSETEQTIKEKMNELERKLKGLETELNTRETELNISETELSNLQEISNKKNEELISTLKEYQKYKSLIQKNNENMNKRACEKIFSGSSSTDLIHPQHHDKGSYFFNVLRTLYRVKNKKHKKTLKFNASNNAYSYELVDISPKNTSLNICVIGNNTSGNIDGTIYSVVQRNGNLEIFAKLLCINPDTDVNETKIFKKLVSIAKKINIIEGSKYLRQCNLVTDFKLDNDNEAFYDTLGKSVIESDTDVVSIFLDVHAVLSVVNDFLNKHSVSSDNHDVLINIKTLLDYFQNHFYEFNNKIDITNENKSFKDVLEKYIKIKNNIIKFEDLITTAAACLVKDKNDTWSQLNQIKVCNQRIKVTLAPQDDGKQAINFT